MSSHTSCKQIRINTIEFNQVYIAHDFPQNAQTLCVVTIFARETASQFCQAENRINHIDLGHSQSHSTMHT